MVEPGWSVAIYLDGFPSNAPVTVNMLATDGTSQQIGAGTTDPQGSGVVLGNIPPDAPQGSFELRVKASEDCGASVYLDVVGEIPTMDVDDETLFPGQSVMIWAGRFAPENNVGLYLDGDPGDALCHCRAIATARADADGIVEMRARIPRDVSPGAHFLVLFGTSFDGVSDVTLSVEITVVAARGTMPPTDTASAG